MSLYLAAAGLALLAASLLGPLSITLARATWVDRAPRAAVALWQALGISALIASIGSGLCVAVERYHVGFAGGLAQIVDSVRNGHPLQGLGLPDALGLTLAADLAFVLGCMLVVVVLRIASSRARHRHLVDLLARPTPDGVSVLDHPAAVAYCVPGIRSRIVISAGAIELLDFRELHAVVAHERGHAHEAHGLVMLPLVCLSRTLGFIPYARLAPAAVAGLLEMAADDYAARHASRAALASALVSMATGGAQPSCGFALTGGSIPRRVDRLLREPRGARPVAFGTSLLVVGLLAIPLAVLLVP
jgi:Zn-dependent protease with chaperone function